MTEAEITQALQKDLMYFKIKVAVRQRDQLLHILLSRTEGTSADYSTLTRLVGNSLRALHLTGVEEFTVYGRLTGQKDYEFEQKLNLIDNPQVGETVFFGEDMEIPGAVDNEPPTELYKSGGPVVDPNEGTLIFDAQQYPQPYNPDDSTLVYDPPAPLPVVPRQQPVAPKPSLWQQPLVWVIAGIAVIIVIVLVVLFR